MTHEVGARQEAAGSRKDQYRDARAGRGIRMLLGPSGLPHQELLTRALGGGGTAA